MLTLTESTDGSKDNVDNNSSSKVVIYSNKPVFGFTDSDADMGVDEHSKSTNPSDYDCVVPTLPKSTARSKDSVDDDPLSEVVMIDHTNPPVEFTDSNAVMGGDIDDQKDNLDNDDDNKQMSALA